MARRKYCKSDQDFMELDAALNLAAQGHHWVPKMAGEALQRLIAEFGKDLPRGYKPMVCVGEPEPS